MLDLTKTRKYYELTWFDGDVIQLPMPKQEILMKLIRIEEINDVEDQFKVLNEVIRDILNSNINHKVFKEEDFNELDLNTINLILTDYMESINSELGK